MKVSIEIDCTPIEARKFLGLPDVEPLQAAMMKEMEGKMASAMGMMDPETLVRTWLPMGGQAIEQFQKMMFGAASAAAGGGSGRQGPGGASGS